MKIDTATYLISAPSVELCPESTLPEYAFIGRSNVGKSSLVNMLTGNSRLAKTSATPGKTMMINYFLINGRWHLVDLPGYGFAKRSKKEQEKFQQMISGYVLHRQQMTCLFVLVDSRHEPQRIDLDFIQWLGENEVPFALVFTKGDKLGKTKLGANVAAYLRALSEQWEELPPHFVTSSVTRAGRDELLDYIQQINASL
ncbi:MAG: YihA family ribosome biogenesis GTP-binding protein [Bacteroidaceae bacterium]|nr:YihA family ribosome biogenesis GTP-binding protein [Bacteroidaceae bacterium]MBQ3958363.1 YihA family ribosome biogenesis GTP-binding protein [Bacteroidaceae bacterium]